MTTTTIQIFDFAPGMSLQALVKEGQPWFIAKDVCDALGYTNGPKAIRDCTDEDERNTVTLSSGIRGNPNRTVINESGLYSLIFRSQKPEAKAFRKWVTSTVLPSLRKDGIYLAGQERPIPERITLTELQAIQAERAALVSERLASLAVSQTRQWARHEEERQARREAFKFLRSR